MYEEQRIYADGAGYAQAMARGGEAPKQRQVASACADVEKRIEIAQKLLSDLEARLSPVLNNAPMAAAGASLKEEKSTVPLVGRLMEAGARAQSLCDSINSIMRRLEI